MAMAAAVATPAVEVTGHKGDVLSCVFAGRYLLTTGEDKTVRLHNPARRGRAQAALPAQGRSQGQGQGQGQRRQGRRRDRGAGGERGGSGAGGNGDGDGDGDGDEEDDEEDDDDGAGGPAVAFLVHTFAGHHGYSLTDLAVTRDHGRFACCGQDKHGFVWDIEGQRLTQKLFGHSAALTSVAFNGAGNLALTASNDRSVRIFDLRSRNPNGVQTIDASHFRDSITGLRVADANVVTSCVDGCVRTFDVRNSKMHVDQLAPPGLSLSSLALSDDDSMLLVSAVKPGALCLLERASGLVLKTYRGHPNDANRIPASFLTGPDDAELVVCGGEDGSVWMWDLMSARHVRTLAVRDRNQPISALACSSRHKYVASATYGGKTLVHRLQA